MTKHWPTIKRVLYYGYVALLWACVVANAYTDKLLPTCVFICLFAMNLLSGGLEKIADAIRTQRNYHIIGDANEITLQGSSLHADHISVQDREFLKRAQQ